MVKKNNKLEDYKYIAIVLLGAMVLSLGLVLIIGQPLYASMRQTNSDLAEKRKVLKKTESNLETLKNLESKQSDIEAKNEKVLAALPSTKDVPRLFTQLEKIASSTGLNIESVSEDTATAAAPVTGAISPITYRVVGRARDYRAFKDALNKIEAALRIVSISDVEAQNGPGGFTTTFTINTYTRNTQ